MKQRYLLDTNICIYWLRDKYDVKGRVNAVGMEDTYYTGYLPDCCPKG